MTKIIKDIIHADGIDISVYSEDLKNDYISLTDIARKRESEYPGYVIQNWLRNKGTISFVGLWESIHNPDFNYIEFEAIKNEAGLNSFVLTPKRWVKTTNAIGIVTRVEDMRQHMHIKILHLNLRRGFLLNLNCI